MSQISCRKIHIVKRYACILRVLCLYHDWDIFYYTVDIGVQNLSEDEKLPKKGRRQCSVLNIVNQSFNANAEVSTYQLNAYKKVKHIQKEKKRAKIYREGRFDYYWSYLVNETESFLFKRCPQFEQIKRIWHQDSIKICNTLKQKMQNIKRSDTSYWLSHKWPWNHIKCPTLFSDYDFGTEVNGTHKANNKL